MLLPCPWVVSLHVCSDQYSGKDCRALCKSLELSEQLFSMIFSELSYQLKVSLMFCLSSPSPAVSWQLLQTVNRGNCRAHLICFPSIRDHSFELLHVQCLQTIVLYILSSCVCCLVILDRWLCLVPFTLPWPESRHLNLIVLNTTGEEFYTLSFHGGAREQWKAFQLGNIKYVF